MARENWGKAEFLNQTWGCYAEAHSIASNTSDYQPTWDKSANECLGSSFCPEGTALNVPESWEMRDYDEFINGCFSKGDSAAEGKEDTNSAWTDEVTSCLATKC